MLGQNFEKLSSIENEGNVLRRQRIAERWQNPDEETKKLHHGYQRKNEELLETYPESNLKKVLEISCKISREVMEHPENLKHILEESEQN